MPFNDEVSRRNAMSAANFALGLTEHRTYYYRDTDGQIAETLDKASVPATAPVNKKAPHVDPSLKSLDMLTRELGLDVDDDMPPLPRHSPSPPSSPPSSQSALAPSGLVRRKSSRPRPGQAAVADDGRANKRQALYNSDKSESEAEEDKLWSTIRIVAENKEKEQYLIEWDGVDKDGNKWEDTWEPMRNVAKFGQDAIQEWLDKQK
ncbi:hypothetical protein KCU78_g602, partial [Aureobasidium melanogenum]